MEGRTRETDVGSSEQVEDEVFGNEGEDAGEEDCVKVDDLAELKRSIFRGSDEPVSVPV